jgi:hypothetical protein
MSEEATTTKTEWKPASWVSELGKWTWLIGIISGIVNVIIGLTLLPYDSMGTGIFLIISGIIAILISFAIIKPKVSDKCAQKDWDHFYNWVWKLSGTRIPFVLFWGIILEIFGYGWGGIPVIIVALMLIFFGPKKYEWSE